MNDLQNHKHGDEGYGSTHSVCNKHNIGDRSVCCECSGKTDCSDNPPTASRDFSRVVRQEDLPRGEILRGQDTDLRATTPKNSEWDEKQCLRCKGVFPKETYYKDKKNKDGLHLYCRKCTRETQAQSRKKGIVRARAREDAKDKELKQKYPEKWSARSKLRTAVKAGLITKLPCEVCGNPKVEGHHEDYSKPLEARWLCRTHHVEIHLLKKTLQERSKDTVGECHGCKEPLSNYCERCRELWAS